jgi:hypothetical protein
MAMDSIANIVDIVIAINRLAGGSAISVSASTKGKRGPKDVSRAAKDDRDEVVIAPYRPEEDEEDDDDGEDFEEAEEEHSGEVESRDRGEEMDVEEEPAQAGPLTRSKGK